jgi:predicted DNA-binding transcriptional regulator YafY
VDRAERLADLLALLLHTSRPLTVEQIIGAIGAYAAEGASARVAFERDKKALRDEGIVVEESADGGYRIDRATYELPDLGLSDAEAVALNAAVSAARLEGVDASAALWKLGLATDVSPPLVDLPFAPALPSLQRALAVRATATFTYNGVERVIEPYGLLAREGWWYVVAFDRVRGAVRVFRLDRIEGDVAVGAPGAVVVPEGFDLEAQLADDAFGLGTGDGVEARVLVDGAVAARVVAELGDERVVARHDDGSVVVALRVTHEPGFLSWVLGLLDHATVQSPPALVDLVVARLEAMAS